MKGYKKPTLSRLKRADPRQFAELCEKAGCYNEALKFYLQSDEDEDIKRAIDLANSAGKRYLIEDLEKKLSTS